ncbi:hypothetical protein C1645_850443 [Glomus cerebriforme]|uniref:HMG box domain-containing protein n=1 Tax=Glomus cerebriforme TaxID=658196 RepID=A0A397SYT8_9GLOM|nr:hypothetical protein C1645_850443 [Glomus cerebriforme]
MSSQIRNLACVFIDSNNSNQVIGLNSRPIIKVPFPPIIDPYNLVVKTKDGRIPARVPNAFIIYRKLFIETAKNDGYNLPMTVISSMASQSWEQESDVVKTEYKRLAKEAYEVRNEMLPKSQRKRKREKWNIISFEKPTRRNPALKSQKPAKTSTTEPIQLPSPISTPESQSINPSPVIPQSEPFNEISLEFDQIDFDFTQYMTPNVPSPEILSIEEDIINSIDLIEFGNNQLLPSPDLSNISSSEPNSQYEFNFEPFSDINESPIITEEELFDLLMPINEDHHMNSYEGLGISDSIEEFIPALPITDVTNSEEIFFSPEMLNMYTYNAINSTDATVTEPSYGLDFDYSYYL